MLKRLLPILATLVFACSNKAGPGPCASDLNCPSGAFCGTDGKCAPLPAAFTVTLGQTSATVTTGKTTRFTAATSGGVSWSVTEPAGGSIDADGTYHAPAVAGTYHVVATSMADATKTATAIAVVVDAPVVPAIHAPSAVTTGRDGLAASVSNPQPGVTYAWSINGGTLASSVGAAIVFAAGSGPSVIVTCTATNAAGDEAQGHLSVAVAPVVVAPAIQVAQTVTAGKAGLVATVAAPITGLSYSWAISGATITSESSGASIVFSAGSGTSLVLSVVAHNLAGDSTGQVDFTVAVVAAPSAVISAKNLVTQGRSGLQASVALQPGSTYAWLLSGGVIIAGPASATVTYSVDPAVTSVTLTCTVTNAAGDFDSRAFTASTVAPAQAPVLLAPAIVTSLKTDLSASLSNHQDGIAYFWTVGNGSISFGASTNAITFVAGATGTVTIRCVATNAAGDGVPSTVTAVIVPVPLQATIVAPAQATQGASGLSASVGNYDSSMTYSWTISGGTFAGGGSTAAGRTVAFGAAFGAQLTLTCTTSNAALDSANQALANISLVAPSAATITAPPAVTQGKGGLAASVPAQSGSTYAWSISGGAITSATNGPSILFTAGSGTTLHLSCIVTNAANSPVTGGLDLEVVPAPVAPLFTGATTVSQDKTNLSAGLSNADSNLTYTWSITGGVFSGGSTSTSGASATFTAGAGTALRLDCTATNKAQDSALSSETLTVVPPPNAPALMADAKVTAGKPGLAASVANVQSGISYSWSITGGAITQGAATSAVVYTAGSGTSLTLTCVATNAAQDTAQASATPAVIVPAALPVFAAASYATSGNTYVASISNQDASVTYAWSLAGTSAGASFSGSATASGSSVPFTVGAVGTLTLQVVATNAAGDSVGGSRDVGVVAAPGTPVIDAANIVTNGKIGLAASIDVPQSGVAYSWTIAGGAFSSGLATASGNNVTYNAGGGGQVTLSVQATNLAGDHVGNSKTEMAVPAPIAPTLSLSWVGTVTQGKPGLTASVTSSQASVSYSWSLSDGAITAGAKSGVVTFTAGTGTSTLLTCTATNAALDTASTVTTVSEVPAPSIPAIGAPPYSTAGSTYSASIGSAQSGVSFAWTIGNGSFVGGATGPTISFTAGAVGPLQLGVTATNAANDTASNSATVQVVAAVNQPIIAARAAVTQGSTGLMASISNQQDGISYSWTISGGGFASGLTTETGSSVSYNAGSGASLTLTAKAMNLAGDSQTNAYTETVVAPAVQPTLKLAAPIVSATAAGRMASVVGPAGGVTYNWAVTAGSTFDSGVNSGSNVKFTAASGTTSVTLTCTPQNPAGDNGPSASITANVVPLPNTPVFGGPTVVTQNKAGLTAFVSNTQTNVSYNWTLAPNSAGIQFANATLSASGSTVSYSAGDGTASPLFNCTAINAAQDSAQNSESIAVFPLAQAPSINVAGIVTSSKPYQIAAVVSPGSGVAYEWSIVGGSLAGSGPPITGTTVYFTAGSGTSLTLSCAGRNAAGDLGPAMSIVVQVAPVPDATITFNPSVIGGVMNAGDQFVASVPQSPRLTFSWTVPVGVLGLSAANTNSLQFRPGVSDGLSVPFPATLSVLVSNAAGDSASSSITLQVVQGPYTPFVQNSSFSISGYGNPSSTVLLGQNFATAWTATTGTFADGTSVGTVPAVVGVASAATSGTVTSASASGRVSAPAAFSIAALSPASTGFMPVAGWYGTGAKRSNASGAIATLGPSGNIVAVGPSTGSGPASLLLLSSLNGTWSESVLVNAVGSSVYSLAAAGDSVIFSVEYLAGAIGVYVYTKSGTLWHPTLIGQISSGAISALSTTAFVLADQNGRVTLYSSNGSGWTASVLYADASSRVFNDVLYQDASHIFLAGCPAPSCNSANVTIYSLSFDGSSWTLVVAAGPDSQVNAAPSDGAGPSARFYAARIRSAGGKIYVGDLWSIRSLTPLSGGGWTVATIAGLPYSGADSNDGSRIRGDAPAGPGTWARFEDIYAFAGLPDGSLAALDSSSLRLIKPISGTNWSVSTVLGEIRSVGARDAPSGQSAAARFVLTPFSNDTIASSDGKTFYFWSFGYPSTIRSVGWDAASKNWSVAALNTGSLGYNLTPHALAVLSDGSLLGSYGNSDSGTSQYLLRQFVNSGGQWQPTTISNVGSVFPVSIAPVDSSSFWSVNSYSTLAMFHKSGSAWGVVATVGSQSAPACQDGTSPNVAAVKSLRVAGTSAVFLADPVCGVRVLTNPGSGWTVSTLKDSGGKPLALADLVSVENATTVYAMQGASSGAPNWVSGTVFKLSLSGSTWSVTTVTTPPSTGQVIPGPLGTAAFENIAGWAQVAPGTFFVGDRGAVGIYKVE